MPWRKKLKYYTNIIDENLNEYMSINPSMNKILIDAMKYSLMAGGKRLRPILVLASYELFSKNLERVIPYACGIEMIHTYSLIHDDLPAMDNDDYRRGKLTNHKVFGEGIAILAGDGLLNYSFEIMLNDALNRKNTEHYLRSIKTIAEAAGIHGMIGGQTVDLESESKSISSETLEYIHLNKTAALISAPLKVGAIIGGAMEDDIRNMKLAGKNLGLAFQIRDDILDIIGDEDKLGKNIGSDESKYKATYPSIHGLEKSKEKINVLTSEAIRILKQYDNSDFIVELSRYLTGREY